MAGDTATSKRVDHLDGIRALAIGCVLGAHWVGQYVPVGRGGGAGVDIFFVLSGFIITTILWTWRGDGGVGRQYREFLSRRFQRLYPCLIGLCLLTPPIWLLLPDPPFSDAQVLHRSGLALVQLTWLPETLTHHMDPFRQTWSLAIEWYFYLLWAPVVLWLRHRVSAATLVRWTVPAALLLWLVPAAFFEIHVLYYGPVARFGELLAGASLALYARSRPGGLHGLRVPDWAAGLAMAAVAAFVLIAQDPKGDVRWVGIPIACAATLVLITVGYAGTDGPFLRLLRWGPITGLGRVSYSLYLWHVLPLYLLDKDQLSLPTPVLAVLGIGCACLLTWLSYVFLERPFTKSRGDALAPAAMQRS